MKAFGIILIALFCVALGSAQGGFVRSPAKGKAPCKASQRLVDDAKPSAFLTFLRKERVETETRRGGDADFLLFTLTNNSCWPVWLDMSGEEKGLGDASLYAEAQDIETSKTLHGSLSCHVCSFNPLGSGRSLMFSVPFKYARRGSVLKVAFEYDWEKEAGVQSSDVLHTANYYFSGLPVSVLPQ